MLVSELRTQYLHAMGIDAWRLRSVGDNALSGIVAARAMPDAASIPEMHAPSADAWAMLQREVKACIGCDLHQTRTQTVFGIGRRTAGWLVIGGAPAIDDEQRGEPFAGPAGQLLDAMLAAISLDRNRAYLTNTLKCRPPGNRDPQVNESVCCEHYLQQQIELIQPQLILALGRVAAQSLLKTDAPLMQLRRQAHRYGKAQTPLIVSCHPADLLSEPKDKRHAWEDLQFAVKVARRGVE